jgi:hypothetical protein
MGAPTSSIFWKFTYNTLKTQSLLKCFNEISYIVGYFRYVNDILVVYHGSTTNVEEISNTFNGLTPLMQFTTQEES